MAGGEFRFGTASMYMNQRSAQDGQGYKRYLRDYMATFWTLVDTFVSLPNALLEIAKGS
jgi:hypothetical protein